jgi:hypothetical protein
LPLVQFLRRLTKLASESERGAEVVDFGRSSWSTSQGGNDFDGKSGEREHVSRMEHAIVADWNENAGRSILRSSGQTVSVTAAWGAFSASEETFSILLD